MRVAIADDEEDMRVLVRVALETDGRFAVVAEATDGQEAVAACEAEQPDALLLDLRMPTMTGDEALLAHTTTRLFAATPHTDALVHYLDALVQPRTHALIEAAFRKKYGLPDSFKVTHTLRGTGEVGRGGAGHQHGLARAHDCRHAARGRRVVAVSGAHLVDERFLGGIDVRAGGAMEGAVLVQEIDRAEVAERRHRQPHQSRQRPLVVERRAKDRDHLGQATTALRLPVEQVGRRDRLAVDSAEVGVRLRHADEAAGGQGLDQGERRAIRLLSGHLRTGRMGPSPSRCRRRGRHQRTNSEWQLTWTGFVRTLPPFARSCAPFRRAPICTRTSAARFTQRATSGGRLTCPCASIRPSHSSTPRRVRPGCARIRSRSGRRPTSAHRRAADRTGRR